MNKSVPNLSRTHSRAVMVLVLAVFLLGGAFFSRAHQGRCANSISCVSDISGVYEPGEKEAVFQGQSVSVPPIQFSSDHSQVLGETTPGYKKINIDLSKQLLFALEDDKIVYEFPISSGKWGPTPTGEFKIWIKLKSTRMEGGNKQIGTYYNLPNVPYTMYFYNSAVPKTLGYGLHGAYWHNNFGHPMSHGCVNLRPADAEKLYNWVSPSGSGRVINEEQSTPITIYGTAPKS